MHGGRNVQHDKDLAKLMIATCVFTLFIGVIALVIWALADMTLMLRIAIPALLIGIIVLIAQYFEKQHNS